MFRSGILVAIVMVLSACAPTAPAATSAPTVAAATATAAPTVAPTATPAPSPTPAASPTVNPLAVPAVPAPVAVTLDAKTTALGVFDVTLPTCPTRPECVASIPKIATLLQKARDAGVLVLYSSTATTNTYPPEIAPKANEATVQPVQGIADLFLRSANATPTFDQTLKDKKITTLLITGTRSNGVVMYTSFGATARGYTVVVPVDTMSGSVPFESNMTAWQLLNQPGFANAENKALAEKAVTLTRSDLVTFK
jgi:nicotinamidase-related amidase